MDSLNTKNHEFLIDFQEKVRLGTANSYLLAISRDGEYPARSIYFYDNAIDAANGYEAYRDWGFAKDFLTVELYEPTGRVHTKVLRRPRGGECLFIRDDYYRAGQILKDISGRIPEEIHRYISIEFAKLFSRDNQRFNPSRFLVELGYKGDLDDKH